MTKKLKLLGKKANKNIYTKKKGKTRTQTKNLSMVTQSEATI